MIAVTYKITLVEPLLATALNGDPNSSVSHPFVPGSMIRGFVASRLPQGTDLPKSHRSLLFDDKTRYLNAYPANRSWERGLPAPMSLRKAKDRTTVTGMLEDHAMMEPNKSKLDSPKPVSGFCWVDDQEIALRSPQRNITVHTLRDRDAGRPTESEGAVYRYEALASGECFVGAVLVPDIAASNALIRLMPEGEYRLGGAATAGYGLVWLDEVKKVNNWEECEMPVSDISRGTEFVVTLLSDVILRNEYGANHTQLERVLGFQVEVVRSYKNRGAVGGFNRKWGLPLAQDVVLRAGSVFVLVAKESISTIEVERLVENGIGERRTEGFGRLAIDWQEHEILTQVASSRPVPITTPLVLTGEAKALAESMAKRRRQRQLDMALVKAINAIRFTNTPPPNSQLARVRIIARNALDEGDLSRVSLLFKRKVLSDDGAGVENDDAMKDPALKKFESARIEGIRLSDWLIDLADHPENVWTKLGGKHQVKLGGAFAQQGMEEAHLEKEYAVRLIDGVLGQAMAQRRTKGGE